MPDYTLENGQRFIVSSDYVVTSQIGVGGHGVVCAAEHLPTHKKVAIKKVQLDGRAGTAVRILREIKALSFFDHPNIVKLHSVIQPESRFFSELYLVIDLMDYDLEKLLFSSTKIPLGRIKCILYNIIRGLKCIHSAKMIHRDLKPSNILISKECDVLICDFGLARELSGDHSEYVETRWYRAPEIIMGWSSYDTKVDIWSVGCMLGEMLLRRPVWPGAHTVDQFNRILRTVGVPDATELEGIGTETARAYCSEKRSVFGPHGEFDTIFGSFDAKAVDLLRQLLAFSPKSRICVEEAILHSFFDGVREDKEPVCATPFDLKLDRNKDDSFDDYRRIHDLLWQEILRFHPNAGQDEITRINSLDFKPDCIISVNASPNGTSMTAPTSPDHTTVNPVTPKSL